MYKIKIYNKYSFGRHEICGETVKEVKDKLNDLYIEPGAKVTLYELKEIPLDPDCYEMFDQTKYEVPNKYGRWLYDNACVYKNWCERRN